MKPHRILRWPIVLMAVALILAPSQIEAEETKGAAPELTREEMEEFLRTAEIVKRKGLSIGVTASERATLTNGRLTHNAHIQTVDIQKAEYRTLAGMELNFRDSYKYNIAAYRLDELLNLNMVPVSVERKVGGKNASVTWWVDHEMMEKDRYQRKIQPPNRAKWNDQMYQVRVFIQLIYNTDPNLGNLLITKDWKLWMIDFTRAFRRHEKLRNADDLVRIDRRFHDGLRRLNEDLLMRELRPYLTEAEIRAILARRDRILEIFDEKIALKGETLVVCSVPGH